METDSSICITCGADDATHQENWLQSSTDLAVLLVLKEHGYTETLDRIIIDWRTHALPECDPLAIT